MLRSIWNLCCSLKLAIYLASAATLLLMGGSLLIPFNSRIFGSMDQLPLGAWLSQVAVAAPGKTWWLYLAALIMILFGFNTLCCFCDWLWHIRARWRKLGEYLLHLGVVLVLGAYIWGSLAGWRHNGLQCTVGELTALPNWPGHYLRVDSFRPVFAGNGPPRDMISDISLLRGEQLLGQARVQINHPYLDGGLVITPLSFGRQACGFRVAIPGLRPQALQAGQRIQLQDGATLEVLRFLSDARQKANGAILYRSDRLGNAAFELQYQGKNGSFWRGWYFVRGRLPAELASRGVRLRPLAPLFTTYSTLTVNYDPGAPLAAVGGGLMSCGTLLALFSFYRKRKRQDRPEV